MYVKINPDRIFRLGAIPTLHITFTCDDMDGDVTKKVFKHIKANAASSSNGWYNVHDCLRMRYNDKNQIEFEERQDKNNKVSLSLTLLPSLLLRDWKVIQADESERLNKFIELHPLVADVLNSDSDNKNMPISKIL